MQSKHDTFIIINHDKKGLFPLVLSPINKWLARYNVISVAHLESCDLERLQTSWH